MGGMSSWGWTFKRGGQPLPSTPPSPGMGLFFFRPAIFGSAYCINNANGYRYFLYNIQIHYELYKLYITNYITQTPIFLSCFNFQIFLQFYTRKHYFPTFLFLFGFMANQKGFEMFGEIINKQFLQSMKKKSTFLPYHVKKDHSTLEVDTFKVILLLSYLSRFAR